ncbi:unnamed protein product, partial [Cyprideis torosa]
MGSSGTERSSKSQVRRGSSWKSACLRSAFFLVLSSLWCSIHGAAYPSFPAAKPELTHGAFTPISPSKGSLEGETPLGTLKELVEEHTHSESELHLLSPNNDDSLGRADSNLPSPMEGQDSVPAGISSSTTPGNTDTYAVDVRGYTPLHVAVEAGHATLTKEIIKNTRASVNAKALSGRTPLHVAAAKGFLSCITALLENSDDIDVNAKASGGFTALHFAASEGFTDSVNLLLNDPRTDVNAMSETGLTPLHLASLADRGSTVSLLLGNKM